MPGKGLPADIPGECRHCQSCRLRFRSGTGKPGSAMRAFSAERQKSGLPSLAGAVLFGASRTPEDFRRHDAVCCRVNWRFRGISPFSRWRCAPSGRARKVMHPGGPLQPYMGLFPASPGMILRHPGMPHTPQGGGLRPQCRSVDPCPRRLPAEVELHAATEHPAALAGRGSRPLRPMDSLTTGMSEPNPGTPNRLR